MRVLVLGAAGRSGREVLYALLAFVRPESIIVADRDTEALVRLCADLPSFPLSPRYIDAEDGRSLRERMKEADLVVGCLGPSYRYEGRVVEAAVECGRHYLSLCDDPDAALEVLALHGKAEKRGVTVLCGCGLSPGISGFLVHRAARRLGAVRSVHLSLFWEVGKGTGRAFVEHLLHVLEGRASIWREGGERRTRAGREWERVIFPPPVGSREVALLAHPEPLMLPRFLGGVEEVTVKGGVGDTGVSFLLRTAAWVEEDLEKEPWRTLLVEAVRGALTLADGRGGPACLRVLVEGEGGVLYRAVTGDYYRLTALAAAGILSLPRGGGWPAGVYAPEEILDCGEVLRWLWRRGVEFSVGEVGRSGPVGVRRLPEMGKHPSRELGGDGNVGREKGEGGGDGR